MFLWSPLYDANKVVQIDLHMGQLRVTRLGGEIPPFIVCLDSCMVGLYIVAIW